MPAFGNIFRTALRTAGKSVKKVAVEAVEEASHVAAKEAPRVAEAAIEPSPRLLDLVPSPEPTVKHAFEGRASLLTTAPEQQAKVVHDYMDISGDLSKAEREGLQEVEGIRVGILQSRMLELQQMVDADPEIKSTLQNIHTELDSSVPVALGGDGGIPTGDVVERLTKALTAAKPLRREQERMYSAERMKRFASAESRMGAATGEARMEAGLAAMKGDLPKVHFEGVRGLFEADEINSLFDMVHVAKLTTGEKLHTYTGLQKLLGMDGSGMVPTDNELGLLSEVYGRDLVDAALSKKSTIARWNLGDWWSMPKALVSSLDVSAPGRQGLLMVTRGEWWKAWSPMLKSLKSEQVFNGLMQEITERPTYLQMREAGLALTELGVDAAKREDMAVSRLADKLPWVGASNRAYTGFLNRVRADVFDSVMKKSMDAGVDIGDPLFQKSLAEWINTSTGRAPLGKFEAIGVHMNLALFSPRLVVSRVQTFNPVYYAGLHPVVRQEAIKSVLSTAAVIVGLLSVAALNPEVTVGTDPTSADFAKIKIGNTRIDLLAGHQPLMKVAAQLLLSKATSSTTGKTVTLGTKKARRDKMDVIYQFAESKASPSAAFTLKLLHQVDYSGKPVKVDEEAIKLVTPMVLQDVHSVLDEYDGQGAILAPLAVIGLGIQTYGAKKPKLNPTGVKKPVTPEPRWWEKEVQK